MSRRAPVTSVVSSMSKIRLTARRVGNKRGDYITRHRNLSTEPGQAGGSVGVTPEQDPNRHLVQLLRSMQTTPQHL